MLLDVNAEQLRHMYAKNLESRDWKAVWLNTQLLYMPN